MKEAIFYLKNLGCAHCAAKMEAKINSLPQVESVTLTFATGQLRVVGENPQALLPQIRKIVRSIEKDVTVTLEKAEAPKEKSHLPQLVLGAVLFILGLVLRFPYLYPAAYLVLGWEVLYTAGRNLVKGQIFDENFLMSIATLGAFAIGEYPEAVGIMLFYRVGEFFEEKAVARSRSQIMKAVDLRPETVTKLHGDHCHIIPAGEAKPGDILLVHPGDRIPLDGVVVSGESHLDTAPITGEPLPVSVFPGQNVTSGCINLNGQLTIRVEKPLQDSMVTRILHSVENAAAGKPKIDRFITRFARIYTPLVVGAAVLTAVIPSLITGNWSYWIYTALSFLVMSCPCALVLSVPLAFFSGIGVGSRKGILFKGGAVIEALADIKAVALDKTGTLTRGDFRVQTLQGPEDLLRLCAACEQRSTHPIAVSIAAYAKEQNLQPPLPESLEEFPGEGVRGMIEGRTVLCGNSRLMTRFSVEAPDFQDSGIVLVAVDGRYYGYLQISDTIKPDAKAGIAGLKKQGLALAMFTGDGEENARKTAEELGIDRVFSRLLPDEKLQKLQALRQSAGATMFIGDGINDAPVLAGADVGAAMGSGADAAIEAADVVFLHSRVSGICESIAIARRTRAIAWQNVLFALGIKAIVMILGLLGKADLWLAVFADSGVAMLCVLNSIRILYKK